MRKFRPSLFSIALASAGLASMPVLAQVDAASEAENLDEEVLVVRGFRASLIKAQALKMDNSSIIEAITAEDIGKLPDTSIAEALARLPGLAAQRLDGRANVISIRGLGEDFTATTFNGREQVSLNDNRGVEFDIYPSDVIGEVVVYKTSDASLASQGIAGTTDLRSLSPLKVGEQKFNVNLRGERNSLGKLNPDVSDTGWRGSFAYVDQFADDTLGVAIAVSHLSSPVQENRWNAWGYNTVDGVDGVDGDDGYTVISGAKPYVRSSELQRDAIMGVMEFEPSENFKTTIDALYIDFEDFQVLRGLEIPLDGSGWANDGLSNPEIRDGLVVAGTFNNAEVLGRNDITQRTAELTAIGQKTEFSFADNWSAELDFSMSRVKRVDFSLESYSGLSTDANPGRGTGNGPRDDLDFRIRENGEGIIFTHNQDYSDPDIMQLGGAFSWGNGLVLPNADAQDGFINRPVVEDEIQSLRFSAERAMEGAITSVEFGLNYNRREKSRADEGIYLTLKDYPNTTRIDDKYLLAPTSLDIIGMGDFLSYDSIAFYNDGNYTETSARSVDGARATNSWEITENILSTFVKANIDTEFSGIEVSGNVGVQVQRIKQAAVGEAVVPLESGLLDFVATDGGDSYTEVLPSLNLNFNIAEGHMVRLGAARYLSRSRMDRMNSSFSVNFTAANVGSDELDPWSANGGNPRLRPLTADGLDLSYEWYYSDEGYVAVSAFMRKLNDWQLQTLSPFDFSEFTPPGEFPGQVVRNDGDYSEWNNVDGGDLSGYEISGVFPGNAMAESLDGFGLQFSGTFTDGSITPVPGGPEVPIPGQSEEILSASVFYENYGFQGRVSMRDRSDFLGEVTQISLQRTQVNVAGETIYDAQIGYDFGEGGFDSLDGLTVQLQVQNINNEPFTTYQAGSTDQIRDFQEYGRLVLFGFAYTF